MFERTKELLDSIHQEYPKVVVEQLVTQHTGRTGVYINNHGVRYESGSGAYGVTVMFSGHEGEKSSSFNYSGFGTDKLDNPPSWTRAACARTWRTPKLLPDA